MKTVSTILIADQKPAKAAFFDMLGQLIALIVIFILTKTTSGSLLYLGIVYSLAPIIVLMISSIWFYNSEYKTVAPSFKSVDLSYAKDLMTLGLKFFIIQIAVIVIYQMNNIIISHTTNPTDVSVFNIAYKYFGIVTMLLSIVITPYWSAFTDAKAKDDYFWMRNSYKKLKRVWIFSTSIVVFMLGIAGFLYKIWIGDLIVVPFIVSLFMAINVILSTWISIHGQLLNGLGKLKLQLYFSMFGLFVNIPLSYLLGIRFGIVGVIGASIVINAISAIWAPKQINLLLNKRAKGVWNQ